MRLSWETFKLLVDMGDPQANLLWDMMELGWIFEDIVAWDGIVMGR